MDVNFWIEFVQDGGKLTEGELSEVIRRVKRILISEPNVLPINSPINVCGNINGQFYDLLEIFKMGGEVPNCSYLFLGGYINRGINSVLVITYLLLLKSKYPKNIFLLRGKQESRTISNIYGFYDEIMKTYGNGRVWKLCCELFDCLPLCALIDNRIFCVHAGLSPDLICVDQIQSIDRFHEIPNEGIVNDLVWTDPYDGVVGFQYMRNNLVFGSLAASQFCEINDLDLICRSQQLTQSGYEYLFNKKVLTIWSAPNYCYRCGNLASFLRVQKSESYEKINLEPVVFKESEGNLKEREILYDRISFGIQPVYFDGRILDHERGKKKRFYERMAKRDITSRSSFLFENYSTRSVVCFSSSIEFLFEIRLRNSGCNFFVYKCFLLF